MNALETPLELPPARENSGCKVVIAGSIRRGGDKLPLIFVGFGKNNITVYLRTAKISGIVETFAWYILLDGDT